jgi:hypothetical protein
MASPLFDAAGLESTFTVQKTDASRLEAVSIEWRSITE